MFWAERRGLSNKTSGYVTEFDFNENAFEHFRLKVLQFNGYNDEWLDFVTLNRNPKAKQPTHDYDIVEGPVADDKIATRINDYLAGKVSKQDFLDELKFIRDTHQICFCTTRSLQMLDHVENTEDISYEISEIGEKVVEKLMIEREIDELQATDLFYKSKIFTQLAEKSTKFYEKSWQEIYELLKKELA